MKRTLRKQDKTKRKQWRDAHVRGEKECHPFVRRLAFLLYAQDRSIIDIFEEAGVARCMLHYWTSGKSSPQIVTICRVLDVMGYELVIQRKSPAKPDE